MSADLMRLRDLGREIHDAFGIANAYMDAVQSIAGELAGDDNIDRGEVDLETVGMLTTIVRKSRVDVWQFGAWLDEIDRSIESLASGLDLEAVAS